MSGSLRLVFPKRWIKKEKKDSRKAAKQEIALRRREKKITENESGTAMDGMCDQSIQGIGLKENLCATASQRESNKCEQRINPQEIDLRDGLSKTGHFTEVWSSEKKSKI